MENLWLAYYSAVYPKELNRFDRAFSGFLMSENEMLEQLYIKNIMIMMRVRLPFRKLLANYIQCDLQTLLEKKKKDKKNLKLIRHTVLVSGKSLVAVIIYSQLHKKTLLFYTILVVKTGFEYTFKIRVTYNFPKDLFNLRSEFVSMQGGFDDFCERFSSNPDVTPTQNFKNEEDEKLYLAKCCIQEVGQIEEIQRYSVAHVEILFVNYHLDDRLSQAINKANRQRKKLLELLILRNDCISLLPSKDFRSKSLEFLKPIKINDAFLH